MDWDKDGTISLGEFKAFLKTTRNEESVNDDELKLAFSKIDIDGDHYIKWEEFSDAMIKIRSQKSMFSEKEITSIFQEIDYNNDGYITPKEAIKAFKKLRERFAIHEWQIQEWIEKTDYDSDGKITLEEFKLSLAGKTLVDEFDSDLEI
uniref:Calmodulinlike 5 [Canis lupus familiaris] n=2 Tax=Lepeophtheirus salmonis TaxID=72036 RepID=A0A0K2UCS1_LEPSM